MQELAGLRLILGSPLIDGTFLVQKMCICSCVTLSTTLLMRAIQFNAPSACDASMFTSLASKYLNCTRSPDEMAKKTTQIRLKTQNKHFKNRLR